MSPKWVMASCATLPLTCRWSCLAQHGQRVEHAVPAPWHGQHWPWARCFFDALALCRCIRSLPYSRCSAHASDASPGVSLPLRLSCILSGVCASVGHMHASVRRRLKRVRAPVRLCSLPQCQVCLVHASPCSRCLAPFSCDPGSDTPRGGGASHVNTIMPSLHNSMHPLGRSHTRTSITL